MAFPYIKTNFHTHSIFCDGKCTLEENVLSAIEKGIKILGFSSHSVYPNDLEFNMKTADFDNYCMNIEFLKMKYNSQLDIRLGFEADYIQNFCRPDFFAYRKFNPDFLIGSVHFLYNGEKELDKVLAVDNTPAILMDGLKRIYKDDAKKLICHYFECERQMLDECNFSIIGHADLIRKFNGKIHFFDENESWYKEQVKLTAHAIKKAGVIAEVNTGALSRGYDCIYPSDYFLSLLYEEGVPVMINSDAHDSKNLDYAFELALKKVREAGYTELAYPEKGSIITMAI